MQIQLNKNFQVATDTYNFMLQKKRVIESGKSAGEKYWDTLSYHASIEGALVKYLDYNIKNSNVESIEELIEYIKELKSEIYEILEPLMKLKLDQ